MLSSGHRESGGNIATAMDRVDLSTCLGFKAGSGNGDLSLPVCSGTTLRTSNEVRLLVPGHKQRFITVMPAASLTDYYLDQGRIRKVRAPLEEERVPAREVFKIGRIGTMTHFLNLGLPWDESAGDYANIHAELGVCNLQRRRMLEAFMTQIPPTEWRFRRVAELEHMVLPECPEIAAAGNTEDGENNGAQKIAPTHWNWRHVKAHSIVACVVRCFYAMVAVPHDCTILEWTLGQLLGDEPGPRLGQVLRDLLSLAMGAGEMFEIAQRQLEGATSNSTSGLPVKILRLFSELLKIFVLPGDPKRSMPLSTSTKSPRDPCLTGKLLDQQTMAYLFAVSGYLVETFQQPLLDRLTTAAHKPLTRYELDLLHQIAVTVAKMAQVFGSNEMRQHHKTPHRQQRDVEGTRARASEHVLQEIAKDMVDGEFIEILEFEDRDGDVNEVYIHEGKLTIANRTWQAVGLQGEFIVTSVRVKPLNESSCLVYDQFDNFMTMPSKYLRTLKYFCERTDVPHNIEVDSYAVLAARVAEEDERDDDGPAGVTQASASLQDKSCSGSLPAPVRAQLFELTFPSVLVSGLLMALEAAGRLEATIHAEGWSAVHHSSRCQPSTGTADFEEEQDEGQRQQVQKAEAHYKEMRLHSAVVDRTIHALVGIIRLNEEVGEHSRANYGFDVCEALSTSLSEGAGRGVPLLRVQQLTAERGTARLHCQLQKFLDHGGLDGAGGVSCFRRAECCSLPGERVVLVAHAWCTVACEQRSTGPPSLSRRLVALTSRARILELVAPDSIISWEQLEVLAVKDSRCLKRVTVMPKGLQFLGLWWEGAEPERQHEVWIFESSRKQKAFREVLRYRDLGRPQAHRYCSRCRPARQGAQGGACEVGASRIPPVLGVPEEHVSAKVMYAVQEACSIARTEACIMNIAFVWPEDRKRLTEFLVHRKEEQRHQAARLDVLVLTTDTLCRMELQGFLQAYVYAQCGDQSEASGHRDWRTPSNLTEDSDSCDEATPDLRRLERVEGVRKCGSLCSYFPFLLKRLRGVWFLGDEPTVRFGWETYSSHREFEVAFLGETDRQSFRSLLALALAKLPRAGPCEAALDQDSACARKLGVVPHWLVEPAFSTTLSGATEELLSRRRDD